MKVDKPDVAAFASILASAVAVLGLLNSQPILILFGASAAVATIIAVFAGRSSTHRLRSADISVEGVSLDSLNVANLR